MWFVRQEINRQLALQGNYFRIAKCRAKICRDILRYIWNFSMYFKVFIYIYLHHDFSPTPQNLEHQVVVDVVVVVVIVVVVVMAAAAVPLHLFQQYSPF
jgi:hypothetical protein